MVRILVYRLSLVHCEKFSSSEILEESVDDLGIYFTKASVWLCELAFLALVFAIKT